MTAALEDSAANPWGASTLVRRLPIVLMIRQPPDAVPNAIASAHPSLTHNGTPVYGVNTTFMHSSCLSRKI